MKTLRAFSLSLCFCGLSAWANSIVSQVHVNYAQLIFPADRRGIEIGQAIIGGKVDFTGPAPVYVTVRIGGQSYTSPTDAFGNFSFLVYANGTSRFDVEGWSGDAKNLVRVQSEFKKSKE